MLIGWRFCVAALCSIGLSSCGSLIENGENIGQVLGALTFKADSRSGDTADQEYALYFVSKRTGTGSQAWQTLRMGADDQFSAALNACAPPRPLAKGGVRALAFDAVSVVTAVGQLVFDKVFAQIQGKIEGLKERGQASYYIRRAWDSGIAWEDVRCIVLQRQLTEAAYAQLRETQPPEPVSRVRMTIVLQRRALNVNGSSGSILAPIYARVDNAVAETAAASGGRKASIRLNLTVVVTSLTAGTPQATLGEFVNFGFKPIVAPLGEPAKTCLPFTDTADPLRYQICDQATGLFVDPPRRSALHVNFVISETGSALTEAENALAALAAVKQAAQPAFTEILTQATAKR